MSRIIEQKQMKDFLKLYTGLVERCFESCCNDFTSKALSSKEVGASSFGEAQRPVDDADTSADFGRYRTRACRIASRSSSSTRSVWARALARKSEW